MQQRFEFDAPKTYNFLTIPKSRDPNDYAIDLTDPNDYWFMVTHVEVSPLKEGENDDTEEEGKEREEKPVVRKEVQVKNVKEEKKVHSSIIPNIPQVRPMLKISRKTQLPTRIHRLAAPQERQRKTVTNDSLPHHDRLHDKSKEAVQRPKPSQQQPQEKVKDQPKKEKIVEQIDENVKEVKLTNKSLGNPAKSKDHIFSRPCPFPPRIQRQWQRREKKDWHSLSPSAKCQAQKSMASLKQEKQAREGKEVPERKKEKKSSRFRF